MYFCGVFDGHGPSGHKVSRRVRDQLPAKLSTVYHHIKITGRSQSDVDAFCDDVDDSNSETREPNSRSVRDADDPVADLVFYRWKSSLLRAFREVDQELSLDSSIESYCSGSTAVTIVKQGDYLIISNLGDSRAVMCSRGEIGQVIAVQLTVDLKPSLGKEAERIRRCKGRVFSLGAEAHVLRLWLPDEDSPGLAMTRAFGDFCLKSYGLISVPQIFCRKLVEEDEFVVLATDGIWDVLTNFEVVKIVLSARKRPSAAKLLAVHAIRAWKSRYPSSKIDDIAVVILFLKPPPLEKSLSDISHVTPDSLSHLNSSISQYTRRSISSIDANDVCDVRETNKGKSHNGLSELGEGESLVDMTLNFPRYSNARHRSRSMTKDGDF
ncbi:putative protein phosphatase 2C 33 isoform X2 [Silene latifolia]